MKLSDQKRLAKHIFRLLKVNEITFPIGRTPNGNLGISFNNSRDDFTIMLDSIPLSTVNELKDENNIELKKMIEKYLFAEAQVLTFPSAILEPVSQENIIPKKKRGRPEGSKNGTKAH